MIFELIDLRSSELIGEYGGRDEALRAIADKVRAEGALATAQLSLRWFDPNRGHSQEVARGERLADLALRTLDDR